MSTAKTIQRQVTGQQTTGQGVVNSGRGLVSGTFCASLAALCKSTESLGEDRVLPA
jgi:hypothetical protein